MNATNSKTLRQLFDLHDGLVCDKWSNYLNVYERILTNHRNSFRHILEIGVQNGGSLEIWAKYFPNLEYIYGVDIDENIKKLSFQSDKIKTIVADASLQINFPNQLEFDLIIDDGSHQNDEIIKTFFHLWQILKPGGLYVIEDIHTSYWQSHKGGFRALNSSIEFFKKLVDVINYEYWGIEIDESILFENGSLAKNLNINISSLLSIASIEFVDSMIIISKKMLVFENRRLVTGKKSLVNSEVIALNGSKFEKINENKNPLSRFNQPYEETGTKLRKSRIGLFNKIKSYIR